MDNNVADKNSDAGNQINTASLSLPKGGGAIKGLGETFQANAFTGSGSYAIPLPLTPARGFEPALSLNYQSGAGNDAFGPGFSVTLSSISRKTSNGIPQYNSDDIFITSDDGELIPSMTEQGGHWQPVVTTRILDDINWRVQVFQPIKESGFSLIEQWIDPLSSSCWWKITDKNNTVFNYGRSNNSRITDPKDACRIYQWLIDEAIDSKGNRIVYTYKAEDGENVDDKINEINRSLSARKYIHSVQYGNYFTVASTGMEAFAFEVVFDYGEYDLTQLSQAGSNPYHPVRSWPVRSDPFSRYLSGFEIRTLRLCHGIMLFHKFAQLGDKPCLVKALQLTYDETADFSFLQAITQRGYRINADGSYDQQALPPLTLSWSRFAPPPVPQFRTLTVNDQLAFPGMLDNAAFQPVDLQGEGLPGMLLSDANTTLYYAPLGNGRYQPPVSPRAFPDTRNFSDPSLSLQSLNANGQLDLVVSTAQGTGYFSQQNEGGWSPFYRFSSQPTDLANPERETADLVGDGKPDLLLFHPCDLLFYASMGRSGYSTADSVRLPVGFPTTVNNGETELVTFADMFGDGLSHRVRIRSGSVEVWPCLGYGRFGEKVYFANAPRFDATLSASRIFLADIDGSGTADLVFAFPCRVEIYRNQSGNAFASTPVVIALPAPFTALSQLRFIDLLGEGTSALVFTSAGPQMTHYYFNFCGEREAGTPALKPYLLTRIDNNLGATTEIFYTSSTQFYLEDKLRGTPWATRLPFPVQVVAKTIVTDAITASQMTQIYRYHEGYFDADAREFNGFGFVESWDSEQLAVNREGESRDRDVPPVYTRSWYHTGACLENAAITRQYQQAYFKGDAAAYDFPDSLFDPAVYRGGSETVLQAYAALKGSLLRTEVYGQDGSALQDVPYTVNESNFTVTLRQPAIAGINAAFLVSPRESIVYHYERNASDPRVQQNFTLEVDPLSGEISKSCTLFLPRRQASTPPVAGQQQLKATASNRHFINTSESTGYHYRGVLYDSQLCEIYNLTLNGGDYCTFADLQQLPAALATPLPYQVAPVTDTLQAGLLTWDRRLFWNDDQSAALPPGEVARVALLHHSASAVFTAQFATAAFGTVLSDETLQTAGGYVYEADNGYWWNRGLVQFYSQPPCYYQPDRAENAFVDAQSSLFVKSTVSYDQPYCLTVTSTTQYLDEQNVDPDQRANTQTAVIDYMTLQPCQLIDSNGNVAQVIFDPLGQVVVTTLFGWQDGTPVGGMRLYAVDGQPAEYQLPPAASFADITQDPSRYLQGATSYFYYDLTAWQRSQQPPCSVVLLRDDYYRTCTGVSPFSCKLAVNYSDGFARELESKTKDNDRWIVGGRTVYNNKGKVCEKYFPWLSDTPRYESQQTLIDAGIMPPPTVTHYDPLLRVIRIDTPKGFFSRVQFTPWDESHYDEDDTVLEAPYYLAFMANYPADPTQQQKDEKDALIKAARFYNTPAIKVIDSVGNTCLEIQTDADQRQLVSFMQTDIQNRVLLSIDPRLYQANQTQSTDYYNFRYRYAMGQQKPACVDSADAGLQRHLDDIFDNQMWSLSARNYCQFISYDRLKRRAALRICKLADDQPITSYADFNLVEIFTYGETQPRLPQRNLRGQLYQLCDLSGIVVNHQYDLQGEVLQNSRQMVTDYKTPTNWNTTPVLESEIYTSGYRYNALQLLLSESTPDGSTVTHRYNDSGLLEQTELTLSDGSSQPVVQQIDYDANGQRTRVAFGNGVVTDYTYETTTLRLVGLYSARPGTQIQTLQDVSYNYDPVGNITRSRNNTCATIFNNNQQVDPLADYTYDAIYRLISANGRQHPAITGNTWKNNSSAGDFKQSRFSQLPAVNDADKLENYQVTYQYDDAGNLIGKQHVAASATWHREMPVEDNSNRLKNVVVDAAGNLRELAINNTVTLDWNCCNNLVSACIIERPDELNDCDYYLYDSHEQRTIKVSERMAAGGAVTLIEESVYLGNYQIRRNISVDAQGKQTITQARQMLRVMDGAVCVLIMQYCAIGAEAGTRLMRFQMTDNLSSVACEYDQAARLISYEEYFPYGGTAIIAGANQAEVQRKVYRYCGKERDDSSGLYYYGARYYAPWLGRWLNPDPAGTVDGLNLYAFVLGNPVTHMDADGRVMTRAQKAKSAKVVVVSNAFEWDVKHIASYSTTDTDLASILDHFGEPTTSVVKTYTDLADRIAYDVKGGSSSKLSASTITDIHLALEASKPLHFQFNDLLGEQWRENMDEYTGGKRQIPLYSVMRSKTTSFFQEPDVDTVSSLNDHLKAISGRPAEVHHILYKAVRPQYANQTPNLMLTQRSAKESVYGPGQHELMHMLASGNDSDKFRVLLPQFEAEYLKWYNGKMIVSSIQ